MSLTVRLKMKEKIKKEKGDTALNSRGQTRASTLTEY